MIKAIVLDFYGVLFSNFDWEVIDERIKLYPEKAQKFLEYKDLSNQGEITNRQLMAYVANLADDKLHPDKPAVYPTPFFNQQLISYLTAIEPRLRLGLLSNGNSRDIHLVLDEYDSRVHFDVIITSSDHTLLKPQLEAYQSMIDQLSVDKEEVIFVDDSQRYVDAARSYGLKAIHYLEESDFQNELISMLN